MNPLADPSTLRTLTVVIISASLTVVLGGGALLFPQAAQTFFHRLEQAVSRFAERKRLTLIVLFFAVVVLRLLALPLLPVPVPGIHDEFSYLLMADTFAHGRLANPPHPMWISFETFHVNWFPKYASMYPPAQGFALALGQILGHPWIGVLLSDAAMCAAILWMLQGWLPARWAFLGGVLAALKFGIASYWMNSYWGGATAAIGGALVLGALPRIAKRPKIRDAILLGLGVAILANSRPYEGFLFCIPAAACFFWWLIGKTKSRQPLRVRLQDVLAPLTLVLVLTAAFMGYYNWRLSGNALLMPHVLNTRAYHTTGLFLWDHKEPEIHYRNQQFEDFYNGWERENYDNTWADVVRVSTEKLGRCAITYFWVGELLALPAIPFLFRDRKTRLLIVTFLLVTVGVFAVIWSNAHYAAPVTCVILALTAQAIRHLRTMRIGHRPVGVALSRAIVLMLVLDTGINTFRGTCDPLLWPCQGDPSRAAIAEELQHSPGKHLIMVRYDKDDHNIHDEWVYNGAEIDNAKVLWARDLNLEQNAKLLAYFKDRKIWLVTPDSDNTYLEPYTPPGAPENDSGQ
ncbi:MAG TPA: hypothetical protein VN943_03315 [Candidatus Acidoferrum sp.]|nr:hypothetical protein [Candidatus Acidoferrum sp.]